MKLIAHTGHAQVVDPTEEEADLLTQILTFTGKTWDPREKKYHKYHIPMYNTRTLGFPLGYLPLVRQILSERNVQCEVKVERKAPTTLRLEAVHDLMRTPFDDQVEAVTKAMKRSYGIIKAPMGSGKSFIAMMCLAAAADVPWVVFAPSSELADQLAEEYEYNFCEKPGLIRDGVFRPGRVTIITFSQTRTSKWERILPILQAAQGVICDEVHTAASPTHRRAIEACTNAYWRIGLSGTPLDRTDEKSIYCVGMFGPICFEISSEELVALGRIARAEITFVRYRHMEPPKPNADPDKNYAKYIVGSKGRNDLLRRVVDAAPKPAMVFLLRKEHVKGFTDALSAGYGKRVAGVTEDTPRPMRKRIIDGARNGDYDVIVAGSVFNTGVNIPNLQSVIVGTGYKSIIATLQRLGRGSRKLDGKDTFTLYDIGDVGEFGAVHTRARDAAYRREGYDTKFVDPQDLNPCADLSQS